MSRALDVYLHDEKVGVLEQDESGQLTFAYGRDYLETGKTAISVSMPLREEPFTDSTVRPYFSGLLPDERARQRLASVLGVSRENTFGLLDIIGGECAGALSLLRQGTAPPEFTAGDIEPLGKKHLENLLMQLRERPLLGGQEGVRLSLAGAQDKLAVCLIDGEIALPKDGRPTTHILKPFIEGLEGTVENELYCMTLAKRMGLDAPAVSKGSVGKIGFILVERYDRQLEENGTINKLHQEDFCQALSVPPELKYEEEGGPGVEHLQTLIQKHARRPAADRLTLQRMLIFHYLVGNADAHAKNYALLYRKDAPDLSPLYDVVCTAAYPRLAKKMAMQIGGRALPDTVQLQHWFSLVPATKPAQRLLAGELTHMAEEIDVKADEVLEELVSRRSDHPLLKTLRKIIRTRAKLILSAAG